MDTATELEEKGQCPSIHKTDIKWLKVTENMRLDIRIGIRKQTGTEKKQFKGCLRQWLRV